MGGEYISVPFWFFDLFYRYDAEVTVNDSICAKIPLKWIKLNPGSKNGRVMTEEQKEAARVRLANARNKIGNNK